MDAYRVELKVLQRRDDERVVGRATQDAIDVASQARVVAHESREAYGDARPPWRDAACRQGHAARARSKLQRAQSSHLNKFPAWESRRTQRRMEMLETPSWTHTHCAGARHSASRSSRPRFLFGFRVALAPCPRRVLSFPRAHFVCADLTRLDRYFRYFRQVASKRRERGRFVVTSVLAASF